MERITEITKAIREIRLLLSVGEEKKDENSNQDMRYVIVRTYSAGVFAGNIAKKKGKQVVLLNARRLWEWSGAASLSQLAEEGVKNPLECKFPCEVSKVELMEAIEILDTTQMCEESIKNVPVWEAQEYKDIIIVEKHV